MRVYSLDEYKIKNTSSKYSLIKNTYDIIKNDKIYGHVTIMLDNEEKYYYPEFSYNLDAFEKINFQTFKKIKNHCEYIDGNNIFNNILKKPCISLFKNTKEEVNFFNFLINYLKNNENIYQEFIKNYKFFYSNNKYKFDKLSDFCPELYDIYDYSNNLIGHIRIRHDNCFIVLNNTTRSFKKDYNINEFEQKKFLDTI